MNVLDIFPHYYLHTGLTDPAFNATLSNINQIFKKLKIVLKKIKQLFSPVCITEGLNLELLAGE